MLATTIEQSKHLLELGLDAKTADCNWNKTFGDLSLCFGENKLPHAVPAWSLSSLLDVIPKEIKKDDKQYGFHLETTHNLYYVSYYRYDIDGIRYLHTTEMNNRAIDAAYEMTCWLLEQGLIKKGDNNE